MAKIIKKTKYLKNDVYLLHILIDSSFIAVEKIKFFYIIFKFTNNKTDHSNQDQNS